MDGDAPREEPTDPSAELPGPAGDLPDQFAGLGPGQLQRRAARGAAWTATSALISVPLAFVANLLVARLIGPAAYGEVAVLSLVIGLASVATDLGFSGGVIQWGASAYARGDDAEVVELLRTSLGWRLLLRLPVLAALVVVFGIGQGPVVVGVLVASVVFSALFGGAALAITIENRTAAAARLTMIFSAVLQVSVVAVAYLTRRAVDVWATRMFVGAAFIPLNLLLLPPARRAVVLRPRFPRHLPPRFWRYCLYSAAGGLVGVLAGSRSEVFVLELFHDPVAVGLFALAFGLAAHITAPVDALLGPLGPAVTGIVGSAPDRAPAAFLRALRYSALLSGALMATLLPAVALLVPVLYGHEYSLTSELVVPLGVASCLASMLNPVVAFVSAHRQARLLLLVTVWALAVDGALAFLLVPRLGAWGAVSANLVAGLVPFPVLVRHELRALGLSLRGILRASRAFYVGLIALALGFGSASALPLGAIDRGLLAALVGGVVFLGGVRLSGGGLPLADRGPLLELIPSGLRDHAGLALRLLGGRA